MSGGGGLGGGGGMFNCTHVHVEDAASQCLFSKNYIQVIVFYLLAQNKVLYLHL